MAWYLVFWRNRSTATVVPAASASQARSRAQRRYKKGYGAIVAARRANPEDSRLIRRGVWVRRRRDGSSPQFGRHGRLVLVPSKYEPEDLFRERPKVNRVMTTDDMDQAIAMAVGGEDA